LIYYTATTQIYSDMRVKLTAKCANGLIVDVHYKCFVYRYCRYQNYTGGRT